jgi:hypothetical protein
LLASGKRVLAAEAGHALKVLSTNFPEFQPRVACSDKRRFICGIEHRRSESRCFAAWSPGAYDQRIAEIDRELDLPPFRQDRH